ncbi:not2 family protein [Grosmannia clavigera kw1407]|uniref:Not2 family protein n=1 Tax=Grosmannia clavigera (strain kw1407 / UAMH 11150) TaxID=655863 RepID=F0XUR6_GROCL|nr:not2 family protein [Grosmannia clavigera kw1407]EFW98435.1 not2 family protein [Grosmannia clavigera kw1407]
MPAASMEREGQGSGQQERQTRRACRMARPADSQTGRSSSLVVSHVVRLPCSSRRGRTTPLDGQLGLPRLPNGKLGNNGSGWAFGSGVPLGAGTQNPSRPQQMGGNISFAQSLGGSQPATPLDLSGQSSLWSAAGSRTIGSQGIQRSATNPLASQQQQSSQPGQPGQQGQQEDMFGSASRLQSNQSTASFRFGSQAGLGQVTASTQPGGIDDFPPLNNRSSSAGEIGQDRNQNLMASLGFGSQAAGASASAQGGRMGNGLLNALSANSRSGGEVRAPVGTRPQETRNPAADDEVRIKQNPFGEEVRAAQSQLADVVPQPSTDPRIAMAAIGTDAVSSKSGTDDSLGSSSSAKDPLAGMVPNDKWGLKGLRALLVKEPGYSAAISGFGLDLASLNVDLGSTELLSTQVYSLFDGAAPRPAVPKFRLPECYKVSNVGPIENKITSFNEETLMWIFYSCPNDIKQQLAAIELTNRNWRWHKRQQVWLTKDDMMMPQVLSQSHERGFYIIWDPANWRKERTTREITLNYADLDNTPISATGAV